MSTVLASKNMMMNLGGSSEGKDSACKRRVRRITLG